jgi:serine phosphatase RsbU (regulator of sigma subunit)
MLSFDGLRELVRRSPAESAADLRDELLAAWRRLAGGRPPEDDLTLVVLRRPVPAPVPALAAADAAWPQGE